MSDDNVIPFRERPKIVFPDAPIRVNAGEHVTPRDETSEEREERAYWDEFYEDETL